MKWCLIEMPSYIVEYSIIFFCSFIGVGFIDYKKISLFKEHWCTLSPNDNPLTLT